VPFPLKHPKLMPVVVHMKSPAAPHLQACSGPKSRSLPGRSPGPRTTANTAFHTVISSSAPCLTSCYRFKGSNVTEQQVGQHISVAILSNHDMSLEISRLLGKRRGLPVVVSTHSSVMNLMIPMLINDTASFL